MKTILNQINLIPEVIGSMVFDTEGKLISHELPPLFDARMLQEAGGMISENIEVLQTVTGGISMLDFRYPSGRIVVRSVGDSFLLLLCSPAVKMPFLNISLNVAVKRLEKALLQYTQVLKTEEETRKLESQINIAASLAPASPSEPVPQKSKRAVAFSI